MLATLGSCISELVDPSKTAMETFQLLPTNPLWDYTISKQKKQSTEYPLHFLGSQRLSPLSDPYLFPCQRHQCAISALGEARQQFLQGFRSKGHAGIAILTRKTSRRLWRYNKKIRSEIPFQQTRKKSIIRHKNCKKMNQVYAFFSGQKKKSDVFRFGSSGLNSIAIAWLCLQVVLFPAVCCAFVLWDLPILGIFKQQ